jgi:hypothetical protein
MVKSSTFDIYHKRACKDFFHSSLTNACPDDTSDTDPAKANPYAYKNPALLPKSKNLSHNPHMFFFQMA